MIPNKTGKEVEGKANKEVGKSRKETKIGRVFSLFLLLLCNPKDKISRTGNFFNWTCILTFKI